MTIGELIGALEHLRSISGDDAPTNVDDARLKAAIGLVYPDHAYYMTRDKPKRVREYTVWLSAYPDGAVAPPECTEGHSGCAQ